jgi:hypothetical protein
MSFGSEAFSSLSDCGINSNGGSIDWEMEFPIALPTKWVTVPRSSPLSLSEDSNNSGVDIYAEMDKVSTAPKGTLLKTVCMDTIAPLRKSHFIIEKLEVYPFSQGQMLPNWQPNSLNPTITINYQTIMGNGALQKNSPKPVPGLVAPYCVGFKVPFKPLTQIDIDAFAEQEVGGVVKLIPVLTIITFRYRL